MILPSGANIVILASNYNPSIVSKDWLFQRNIFTETVKNFVHTPIFALVENDDFGILVDEQRLQVTTKKVTKDKLNTSEAIAKRFINILPETPYKAVGMNYGYTFPGEKCRLQTIISAKDKKLKKLISSTYELGATVVFEFRQFVVTFTALPSAGEVRQIRMNFNFHSNTANVEEVKKRLSSHMKTLEKAGKIIEGLIKND